MTHTLITHEDGEPFVRFSTFVSQKELALMAARTHNALLDRGYALTDTREREDQRAMTYSYVKNAGNKRKVYMVSTDE